MNGPQPPTLQRFESNARRFKRAGRFLNLRHLLRCRLPPDLIRLLYEFCQETQAKAAQLPGIRSAIATGHAADYGLETTIDILEPGFQHIESCCRMNIAIVGIKYEYLEIAYAPFVRDEDDDCIDPPDELYPCAVDIVDGASGGAQYVPTYELLLFSRHHRADADHADPCFRSRRIRAVPFMVAPSGELMLGSASYSGLRRRAAQFPLELIFNEKWRLYRKNQAFLQL